MAVYMTEMAIRLVVTYILLGSMTFGFAGGKGELLLAAGASQPMHSEVSTF